MFFILVSYSSFYPIPVASDFSPAFPAELCWPCLPSPPSGWLHVHLGMWPCGFAPLDPSPPAWPGREEVAVRGGGGNGRGAAFSFPFLCGQESVWRGAHTWAQRWRWRRGLSEGRLSLGPEFASLVFGSMENTLLNVHKWSHPNFRHAIKSVLRMRKFHFLYPSSSLSPVLITGFFSLWVF